MKLQSIVAALTLFVILPASADEPKDKKTTDYTGKLQTGVVAIGGETTGIVLTTKTDKFELYLGKNKELLEKADKLNGKEVVVTGILNVKKGVEVKERKIIVVSAIKEAEAK